MPRPPNISTEELVSMAHRLLEEGGCTVAALRSRAKRGSTERIATAVREAKARGRVASSRIGGAGWRGQAAGDDARDAVKPAIHPIVMLVLPHEDRPEGLRGGHRANPSQREGTPDLAKEASRLADEIRWLREHLTL